MTPSIFDVARESNVSIATVSRTINQPELVNPETRERVLETIEKLNYYPNVAARALLLKRTETLGLILPDIHSEFYSEIIRGANQRAREKKHHIIVTSSTSSKDKLEMVRELHNNRRVDGLILMITQISEHLLRKLSLMDIPVVIIDKDVGRIPLDNIVVDNYSGAYEATEHLLWHNYKEIFFFGGFKDNIDTQQRFTGYKDALRNKNLPVDENKIFFLDYSYESGFQKTKDIKNLFVNGETAIFAANDEMASGVINALIEMGLKVPEDVGVIGYDNIRLARFTNPCLTTVSFPMFEIGREAVDMLLGALLKERKGAKKTILRTHLIIRQSCGCNPETKSEK